MVKEATIQARDLIRRSCEKYSTRPLATFEGETYTYEDAWNGGGKLATVLDAKGINPGDHVGIIMENQLDFFTTFFACIRGGYVFVPMNAMLTAKDFEYILSNSGSRAVIMGGEFTETIAEIEPELSELDVQIAVENPTLNQDLLADVLESTDETHDYAVNQDDLLMLPYSGGTTGKPKGIKHTHRTIASNMLAHVIALEIRDAEEMLVMTPLAHGVGYMTFAGLAQGAHFTLKAGFDPEEFLSLVNDSSITWTFLVPTQIYRILDNEQLDSTDVSSINTIAYGAAPITPERLKQAIDLFGEVFIQLYGQTEMPDIGTILPKGDHVLGEEKIGSCGQPATMVDVRIAPVDDYTDTTALGRGEEGELIMRSPYVMRGYRDKPEKTEETLVDGWLRTGDIGRKDEDGYVYLLDRKHDMIVSGGMNVYTTDVEESISQHEHVSQVAVIGVPHEDWGEAVHAVVVTNNDLKAEDLKAFADKNLADYKKPKSVEFVDELPTTPYGKINKKALREPHWEKEEREI